MCWELFEVNHGVFRYLNIKHFQKIEAKGVPETT